MKEYGNKRSQWPDYVRFLVSDYEKQRHYERRHPHISLDAMCKSRLTAPDIEAALEVRDRLDCLTPRQREAVLLRADGYNSREIAEIMNISHREVFLLLARAKIEKELR